MSLRGAKTMVGKYVEIIDYKQISLSKDRWFKITDATDYNGIRVSLRRLYCDGTFSSSEYSVRYDILRDKRRFRVIKIEEVVNEFLDNGWSLPTELVRYAWRTPKVREIQERAAA